MGDLAPQERGVQHARNDDVVYVAATPGEDARILGAQDPRSDGAGSDLHPVLQHVGSPLSDGGAPDDQRTFLSQPGRRPPTRGFTVWTRCGRHVVHPQHQLR